jgi:hypothetical protein
VDPAGRLGAPDGPEQGLGGGACPTRFEPDMLPDRRAPQRAARRRIGWGAERAYRRGVDAAAARRLLGVSPLATPREIEAAFRARALATHPDRGGAPESFRLVVEARRTLLAPDPGRRPPPVTVVPDVTVLRQLLTAVLRRLLDRPPPRVR